MLRINSLPLLLLLPAYAVADLPHLEPEPGVYAQVQKQGERYFLQQPDGSHLELNIPEGNDVEAPDFGVDDYDFDGYPDFAISVPAGMVNSVYHLYLYRPALQRFERLRMPAALTQRANCSQLSELEPKANERALYSRCRSGPRWYFDAYRFDVSGTPWLYKTLQVRHDYDPEAPVFFPVFEKTFDLQGEIIASRALDDDDRAQTWTVPNARLYLHRQPNDASRSNAYLIEGDVCEVLDQQDNWLLIRYLSRKGPLERWVSLDEAYSHQP
ncbi:XAC2610-related protein [Pseudomonas sp. SH1-B]